MEKAMLNIKQTSRIETVKIKKLMPGKKNIIEECLLRKWNWAGHLTRHSNAALKAK